MRALRGGQAQGVPAPSGSPSAACSRTVMAAANHRSYQSVAPVLVDVVNAASRQKAPWALATAAALRARSPVTGEARPTPLARYADSKCKARAPFCHRAQNSTRQSPACEACARSTTLLLTIRKSTTSRGLQSAVCGATDARCCLCRVAVSRNCALWAPRLSSSSADKLATRQRAATADARPTPCAPRSQLLALRMPFAAVAVSKCAATPRISCSVHSE